MPGLQNIDVGIIPQDIPYWINAFGITQKFGSGLGAPVDVEYALATSGQTPHEQAYRPLSIAEIENIEASLRSIAADTGLDFVQTDVGFAELLIGASSDPNETAFGRTWQSIHQPVEAVAYDVVYDDPEGLAQNGYIFVHELLHAVGLNHSTAYFGNLTDEVIPDDEGMGTTLFGIWHEAWNEAPQLFDLAALQFLYGPDVNKRSGNDVYKPILDAFDSLSEPDQNVPLLWDGGGIDTIDLSTASGPANAGLETGVVYQVNTVNTGILDAGTYAINHNSVIERIIGTAFDDILFGTQFPNDIFGGPGNDVIYGGSSSDFLSGDQGSDVLFAGTNLIDGDLGDTAHFSGSSSEYIHTGGRDYAVVIASDGSRDKLFGFEYLIFDNDETIELGAGSALEGAGAPEDFTTAERVALLYEAVLDRDGDIDLPGLNFYIDVTERDGLTDEFLAQNLMTSPEFTANFGDANTLSNSDLLEKIYLNILDRPSDAAGHQFYLDLLNAGTITKALALADIAISPENTLASTQVVMDLYEVSQGEWAFL